MGIFEITVGVFLGTSLSSVALAAVLYVTSLTKKRRIMSESSAEWEKLIEQVRARASEGTE